MDIRPKKYYAMCSFGKDSLATILLALQHGEPLDGAIFSEVMFDHKRNISGENPKHIRWINEVAIPKLESMGVPVVRLRGERDYVHYFTKHVRCRGKQSGKLAGFPLAGLCSVNRDCKLEPIKRFLKDKKKDYDIVEYVGIAIDEPIRLKRLNGGGKSFKMSILAKYGYTEQMAYDLCKQFGLLSPIYEDSHRGGCWFCPNQTYPQLIKFRKQNPELWQELLELGKTPNLCAYGFKYGITIEEIDKKLNDIEKAEKMQLSLF